MSKIILKERKEVLANRKDFEILGKQLDHISPVNKVWIDRENFHGKLVSDIIFDYNFNNDYAVIYNGNGWFPVDVNDTIYFEKD